MKAEELRLGNLVSNINPRHNDSILTIESIGDNHEVNVFYRKYLLSELEPIPLTEEWLFKFGFYLRDGFSNTFKLNVEKHQYDCSEITYSEKEGLFRFSNGQQKGTTLIPHIKYVHQLQNLYFALTGEELTLNP